MTGEEKQLIFNLLKTASSWNYAYTSPDFDENSFPKFEDDFVEIVSAQKIQEVKTQNIKNPENQNFTQKFDRSFTENSEINVQNQQENAKFSEKTETSLQNFQNQKTQNQNQNFMQTSGFSNSDSNDEEKNSWKSQSEEKLKEILSKAMKAQVEQNVPREKTENSSFYNVKNQQNQQENAKFSEKTETSLQNAQNFQNQNQQKANFSQQIATSKENAQSLPEIQNIAKKISECQNCILSKTRTNTVPGEGVQNPLVMVIGEGPGEEEDLSGRPFVGKAGQLLDKMLAAINLDRRLNCYIANIVKCRPPRNRTPMIDESQACKGFLQAQIHVLKPKYILAMGRTAVQNLLETSEGINALRGKWLSCNGIPLMATYHPSALLHDVSLKAPAWQDLKLFRKKLIDEYPKYDEEFRQFKANFASNS